MKMLNRRVAKRNIMALILEGVLIHFALDKQLFILWSCSSSHVLQTCCCACSSIRKILTPLFSLNFLFYLRCLTVWFISSSSLFSLRATWMRNSSRVSDQLTALETALLRVHDLLRAADAGNPMIRVLVDRTAALETVDRYIQLSGWSGMSASME